MAKRQCVVFGFVTPQCELQMVSMGLCVRTEMPCSRDHANCSMSPMQASAPRQTYVRVFRRVEPLTWTRETAYATGLVASDGYLSAPRYVGFGSRDLELVESFLRCFGRPLSYGTVPPGRSRRHGPTTIVSSYPYYQALCSDPLLYEFLTAAGLGPRKSTSLGPILAPTLHLPDVIRGVLDGDGSIVPRFVDTTRRGVPYRRMHLTVVFYSSSRAHLMWLQAFFASLAIRGSIYEDKRPAHPSYRLALSDRQSVALLTTLYEDPRAPRLERKYGIWLRYRAARSLAEYAAFV